MEEQAKMRPLRLVPKGRNTLEQARRTDQARRNDSIKLGIVLAVFSLPVLWVLYVDVPGALARGVFLVLFIAILFLGWIILPRE